MTSRVRKLRNDIIATKERFCFLCGEGPLQRRALYLHWLVPLTKGGTDTPANIEPACGACHANIGELTMKEYYSKRMAEMKVELDNIKRAGVI